MFKLLYILHLSTKLGPKLLVNRFLFQIKQKITGRRKGVDGRPIFRASASLLEGRDYANTRNIV